MAELFLDVTFPNCPSFGFTSEPQYSVTAIETAGGQEVRNRNWSRPRLRFTATVGPRAAEDIQIALNFWHGVGGMAYGFRFEDGADYKSCFVHLDPSSTDQPLEPSADSPSSYQLLKRYTIGTRSQDREIYKPRTGTILIAEDGVLLVEETDYTLDYDTGLVTFVGPEPSGVLTWGGEFDVPARFDSEFPISLLDKEIQSVQFTLKELRREDCT